MSSAAALGRKPAICQCCGHMMGQTETDGWTQYHVIGSAPYTMRAVSIIVNSSVGMLNELRLIDV